MKYKSIKHKILKFYTKYFKFQIRWADFINVKIRAVILSALGETRGRAHGMPVYYSLQLRVNLQLSGNKHLIMKAQTPDRMLPCLNRSEPFPGLWTKSSILPAARKLSPDTVPLCPLCCRPSPASGLCTCCPPRQHLLSLSTGLPSHIASSLLRGHSFTIQPWSPEVPLLQALWLDWGSQSGTR